jgi:hypothetical protein
MPITADGNWINTFSGVAFHPLEPSAEDVRLVDIAHSLSQECRYTGHTLSFYSVAEHSVLVAKGVKALGGSLNDQRWALLHDATEAYLSDISSPVKKHPSFSFYREVEKRLMDSIAEHFKLEGPEPDVVRFVDAQMIAFESVDPRIIQVRNPKWPMMERDPRLTPVINLQGLLPASAEGAFMASFKELFA